MSHSRPVFYLAPTRPLVHVLVQTFFLSLPPSPPHFLPLLISRNILSGHSILLHSLNIHTRIKHLAHWVLVPFVLSLHLSLSYSFSLSVSLSVCVFFSFSCTALAQGDLSFLWHSSSLFVPSSKPSFFMLACTCVLSHTHSFHNQAFSLLPLSHPHFLCISVHSIARVGVFIYLWHDAFVWVTRLILTPVAGSNLLLEKVSILRTFPQNSQYLELFQVMSQ